MWWFRFGVSTAQWLACQSANPKAMGLIPIQANSLFLSLVFPASRESANLFLKHYFCHVFGFKTFDVLFEL